MKKAKFKSILGGKITEVAFNYLKRKQGNKEIFPIKVYFFQTGILSTIFIISGLMITGHLTELTNIYIVCLVLFLLQSTVAFIRTMFVRVH